MKSTGGLSWRAAYRVLETRGRHVGRHTEGGVLEIQQVDGGFQDADADRLVGTIDPSHEQQPGLGLLFVVRSLRGIPR